jgi:hypothetical protein
VNWTDVGLDFLAAFGIAVFLFGIYWLLNDVRKPTDDPDEKVIEFPAERKKGV